MLSRFAPRILAVVAMLGTALLGARVQGANHSDPDGLTVHEWGTFTSIAGPDGQAVEWRPLTGPSDLPCFVTALNPNSIKTNQGGLFGLKATVRMETPVLYFYSPTERTVRASVSFPRGIISEWYPQATISPGPSTPGTGNSFGRIQWDDVRVMPGAKERFATDSQASHYYAARATDAAPLQAGGQQEKFLFYRGLGSFPIPVAATFDNDGNVLLKQNGLGEVNTVILFERRAGHAGYRVVHAEGRDVTIPRPELTATMGALHRELHDVLIGQGLYAREAAAMIDTWRDSWFEEGARLFYLVPRASVDAVLPLRIEPRPDSVARVFVGRLEILTPEIATEVEQAVRTSDQAVLRKYGRFLEPISDMLKTRLATIDQQGTIDAAIRLLARQQSAPAACPGAAAARAVSNPFPVP